jgi:hypothetical protein
MIVTFKKSREQLWLVIFMDPGTPIARGDREVEGRGSGSSGSEWLRYCNPKDPHPSLLLEYREKEPEPRAAKDCAD